MGAADEAATVLREGIRETLLLGVALRLCEPEMLEETNCERVEDPDIVPLPLGVLVVLALRDPLCDGLAVVAGDRVPDVLGVGDILAEVLTVPVTESVDEPDSVGVGDSVMASDRVGVPVWVTEAACVNVVVCDSVNLDDVCDPVWEVVAAGVRPVEAVWLKVPPDVRCGSRMNIASTKATRTARLEIDIDVWVFPPHTQARKQNAAPAACNETGRFYSASNAFQFSARLCNF